VTVRLLSISLPTVPGGLEALRRLLDQSFLAEGGWGPAAEVLVPAPGYLLLGFRDGFSDRRESVSASR
jgi:hypothetical protein